ncbi:MAG: T9SS type A sorting domain-containing protein, partial [Bacteroidota bacterium]
TVADIKAPAPVCVQNLTVSLMPTNAGGSPNAGMTVVKAIDVFQDINRNWENEECTPTVKAKIVRTSRDTATVAATILAYSDTIIATCADRGGIAARVYLIDGAGNYNYCSITIAVEDNASICGAAGSAAVAGAIQTESKATVEGVQVNLSGQTQKSFATGVNGLFIFNNLTAGADYTVTPSLNKGFLNGVSTFDLVLISKHILGVQPLNTPYKLIAADVNNSKSVTTLDLIQLRKLILNIDATFANNSSWRFVDASYTFPNASNPWAASFPEVKNVNDLVGSLSANFVAIKVGDVNGNAIANSTQGSVRNLTSNLGINVADMNLVAGNEYKVDFTAADLNGIEGFQFTLNLDKKGLELVDLVPGIAAEENFGIFAEEGVVTASWNGEAKGGVLFSLVVRAKSNTTLSEVLNLNSRYTAAEAYKGGEVVNVGLNFNASKASANYELYQNTPNPFAGESIIGFNLPAAGAATLTIQDVTGRTLKVINGQYAKGYNQVSLKSTELSATGVLTYTFKAADFTATRKMIIVE